MLRDGRAQPSCKPVEIQPARTAMLKCVTNERLSIDTAGWLSVARPRPRWAGSAYAIDEPLAGTPDLVWQRAANASRSLWSRTLASNAGPAKSVVESGTRPAQTTARRLRY